MPATKPPGSAYDQVGGLFYFARMLDKIRLQATGELGEDYFSNLGIGFDERCCKFLGVPYAAVKARTLTGGSDAEVLEWCLETGRRPDADELFIWNAFMSKRGWRDDATPRLEKLLCDSGNEHRHDILTMFDMIDLDEGRSS
jgi:hypothetical protein